MKIRINKGRSKDLLTLVMLAVAGDLSRFLGLNLLNDIFSILAIFGAITFVCLYFLKAKKLFNSFTDFEYQKYRIDNLESNLSNLNKTKGKK